MHKPKLDLSENPIIATWRMFTLVKWRNTLNIFKNMMCSYISIMFLMNI